MTPPVTSLPLRAWPRLAFELVMLKRPTGRSITGFRCGTAAQERPFRSHPAFDRRKGSRLWPLLAHTIKAPMGGA